MVRRCFIPMLLFTGLTIVVCGCSNNDAEKSKIEQSVDPAKPYAGIIRAIQSGKLQNYPEKTIGEAFGAYKYLIDKDWKAAQTGGNYSVDFAGWLTPVTLTEQDRRDGIVRKGLDITFVVNTDGSFYVFMVSMIEAGAEGRLKRTQVNDINSVLSRIYKNKKIEM